tara:strand:+ start:4472 stop:4645 length:174 start_codon:yes stop_codon:yes gene_type:complete
MASVEKVSMCWSKKDSDTREEEEQKFISNILDLLQSKHKPGCYEIERQSNKSIFRLS